MKRWGHLTRSSFLSTYLTTYLPVCVCVYVYVGVCLCDTVSEYECVCVCMSLCVFVCVMYMRVCVTFHICVWVCAYMFVWICMYVCACVYTYVYICVTVCMCVCVYWSPFRIRGWCQVSYSVTPHPDRVTKPGTRLADSKPQWSCLPSTRGAVREVRPGFLHGCRDPNPDPMFAGQCSYHSQPSPSLGILVLMKVGAVQRHMA